MSMRRWGLGMIGAALLWVGGGNAIAQAAGPDPELEYNVTFEISNEEAKTLTAVHVLDTAEIGGRRFLVVLLPGYRTRGFINIDSIRAILPTKQGLATGY